MREVHEYENSSVCAVVRFDPRNKVLLRAELVSDWSCTLLLESNREQARQQGVYKGPSDEIYSKSTQGTSKNSIIGSGNCGLIN